MPKYLVESQISDSGTFSSKVLHALVEEADARLAEMTGAETHWIECHVTEDVIYWVYLAPDEVMVREHARRCRLPVNRIAEIKRTLDPTFAADPSEPGPLADGD